MGKGEERCKEGGRGKITEGDAGLEQWKEKERVGKKGEGK